MNIIEYYIVNPEDGKILRTSTDKRYLSTVYASKYPTLHFGSKEYTPEDVEKIIDELDDKCDILTMEFDSYWFGAKLNECPPEESYKNFEKYCEQKDEALGQALIDLQKWTTLQRMYKTPKLTEIPEHGDQMSLEEFIDNVKSSGFIDYDGYGNYIQDGKKTDINIFPSDVKKGQIRKEFDSIVWFNR